MCTYNLFNIFFNKKSRKHITHIIYSSTNNLENVIQIHIGIGFSNRKTLAIVGLSLFISLIHISAISKYSFTWASIRPPSHKILASIICICLSWASIFLAHSTIPTFSPSKSVGKLGRFPVAISNIKIPKL